MLYLASLGVCAGIAVALLFHPPLFFAGFVLLCAAALFVFGKREKKFLLCAVVLAAAVLGLVRTVVFEYAESAQTLTQYAGKTVAVVGRIVDDPETRATSVHAQIQVELVDDEPASGTLLAVLDRTTKISYGDTVEVSGTVVLPEAFITNTGHEFDYPGYLRVRGVSAMIQRATLESDTPGGFSIVGGLFSIKHAFEHSLERVMPEPHVSLLEGILLGERRSVPKDLTQAFVNSGLIHVVVLSGYNISIVSEGVFRVCAFLPRAAGFGAGGVSIILFALMAGGGATTIRACVMALITIIARYYNRPTVALRALALAAMLMVLWNPPTLLFDPSFILSVLATFGLITLSPWTESWLVRYRIFRHKHLLGLRSIAASTIAVQIFVLPALLYFTGVLSFLALPSNVLALPVVPPTMLLGFISGILSMLHPVLAFVPVFVTGLLLSWMMLVANTSSNFPFSTVIVAAFPVWVAVVVYVPLACVAMLLYSRTASPPHPN